MDNGTKNKPKIRIGNDIKLDLSISKRYISDSINLKSVKCILVNTTMTEDFESKNNRICSTQYSINSCGHKCYNYDFHHCVIPCMHKPCYEKCGQFGPVCEICDNKFDNDPVGYTPRLISTPEKNRFFLLFPAADQHYIGNYNLIVTALVYEQGYDEDNLRTITIDYPNIFELVKTTEEADEDMVIRVGKSARDNVESICPCGPTVDKVTKGNVGILAARILPSNSLYKEIIWTNPTGGVDLLNTEGEVVLYVGKLCDVESGESVHKVRASSKYFPNIFLDYDVTVVNYAADIQVISIGDYKLGTTLPYKKSTIIIPEVLMTNGDRISIYTKNLQLKYATIVDESIKDSSGTILATITTDGSGRYIVTNVNPYMDERVGNLVIRTDLPSEDGKPVYTTVTFKLGYRSLITSDKYISEVTYDDNAYNITMQRSDDETITTDLREAVGWTTK